MHVEAGVHFPAKRVKDFFLAVFAWRKDYVIKKFRANTSTFLNRYPIFDLWKCFFFRLTNDNTNNVEMLRVKVDIGL